MKLITTALLLAASGFAQDARLMLLDSNDTQIIKDAYKKYKDAQAEWERTKWVVALKYTVEFDGNSSCKLKMPTDAQGKKSVVVVIPSKPENVSYPSFQAADQKLPDCTIADGWSYISFSRDFRILTPGGEGLVVYSNGSSGKFVTMSNAGSGSLNLSGNTAITASASDLTTSLVVPVGANGSVGTTGTEEK